MTAAEYRIIREQARSRIAASQRFDRDAVKAMLVDALESALPAYIEATGHDMFTLVPLARLDLDDVDVDHLTKTVIEWIGGKGAA